MNIPIRTDSTPAGFDFLVVYLDNNYWMGMFIAFLGIFLRLFKSASNFSFALKRKLKNATEPGRAFEPAGHMRNREPKVAQASGEYTVITVDNGGHF